ncbi:MAG: hypothetical protein R2862_08625 [Thermoanaerobaculia bacterium]
MGAGSHSRARGPGQGNYARTNHITRFINRNAPEFGSPWSSGLPPGGVNGISTLTSVESTAKSRYWGVTVGANKRMSDNWMLQAYYTYSEDKSDDDNERDPFTFRYVDPTQLDREYNYSDRDQRHRLNALALFRLPWDIDLNLRYSYRSAQPKSVDNRIAADGSIILRNTLRKDNEFNSLDLRVSKMFDLGAVSLEPIVEVFNVFDSANFLRRRRRTSPSTSTATVRSGAGDPRQIQLESGWSGDSGGPTAQFSGQLTGFAPSRRIRDAKSRVCCCSVTPRCRCRYSWHDSSGLPEPHCFSQKEETS